MPFDLVTIPCRSDNYAFLLRSESGRTAIVDAPEAAPIRAALDERGWGLDEIWINFSDPWPKTRHAHRRLIQPPFVADVARALRPGGRLFVATDDVPYAHQIDEVLAGALEVEDLPLREVRIVGRQHGRKDLCRGDDPSRIEALDFGAVFCTQFAVQVSRDQCLIVFAFIVHRSTSSVRCAILSGPSDRGRATGARAPARRGRRRARNHPPRWNESVF